MPLKVPSVASNHHNNFSTMSVIIAAKDIEGKCVRMGSDTRTFHMGWNLTRYNDSKKIHSLKNNITLGLIGADHENFLVKEVAKKELSKIKKLNRESLIDFSECIFKEFDAHHIKPDSDWDYSSSLLITDGSSIFVIRGDGTTDIIKDYGCIGPQTEFYFGILRTLDELWYTGKEFVEKALHIITKYDTGTGGSIVIKRVD